jgi:PAS domain S-box-containing protein
MSPPQLTTVLHVDDDPQFGDLTKTILEREYDTFEVITETNPEEVEKLLDEHGIDCLVSDYDMPEMDGIELLERVRENDPSLPVILFTGKGTEEVASRAISAGVTEYLQKEAGTDQFTVLANRILNAVEHKIDGRKREQYRTIVETAGDAMYVLDEEGYIEIVNEVFERMSGYDRDELIGNHASEFLSSDQVERGTEAIQSLLQSDDRDSELFTFRAQRPDGESRIYETTVSLVERNGFAGSVGIIRDITDARRKEELLSGLFEESLHGIGVKEIVTDEAGEPIDYIYKRVNDRFEELTGLDADEAVGNRATEVIDGLEDTPFIEVFGEVALDGTTAQFEQYSAPLDRYYEVSAFSPRHGECISIFSDITERKERELELRRERDRLDEFASVISHDLRSPLEVATTRTELAAQECDSDHLTDVTEALSRMEALIDDLLVLARQGETVGEREQIVLEDVVSACWRNVETTDSTITIEGQATLAADRTRLTQALENLLCNAIDHGGEWVTITVGVLDDEAGFYLADDGPGIPEEHREDVFDSGFTTSRNGTGFGLAIVERICAAHGWNITVTESDVGGARFEITGIDSIDC